MKAYSLDLRQKIIDIYKGEPISQRQACKTLWCQPQLHSNTTQTLSARRHDRNQATWWGKVTKTHHVQLMQLKQLVAGYNDATLEELCDLLEQHR